MAKGVYARNDTEKTTAIVNSLDDVMRSKENDSLRASLQSYLECLDGFACSMVSERASLKARGISLVTLAWLAISLGVFQLFALAYMVGVITTRTEDFTSVGRVINTFALGGVSFDALGAIFALWRSYSLSLMIGKIDKIFLDTQKLGSTLYTFCQPDHFQEMSFENLANLFADLKKSSVMYSLDASLRLVNPIENHLSLQHDSIAFAIIAFGSVFFLVSFFSFNISTQPLCVWVPTTVVGTVTLIILCVRRLQPGFLVRTTTVNIDNPIVSPLKSSSVLRLGEETSEFIRTKLASYV